VSVALLSDSETVAPPAGAALFRVMVQVLEALGAKVVGLQAREETSTGATRLTVALAELLLYVAVTVALWSLATLAVVALNVAEVEPAATVTEAGTVSTVLVFVILTAAPPVGAAFVNVTVQVPDAFGPKLAGHASEEICTEDARPIVTLLELPLYVAVIVAFWSLRMVTVVALNVAEIAPAATVAEAGIVNTMLVFESVTSAPPLGAASVRVTVQVLEESGPRLVGLHASEETSTGATRLMVVVWEAPFNVAVTIALWSLGIVPAVAENVPVVAPAATVTDGGAVSRGLLLEIVTAAPPAGAAPLNVTVQLALPEAARLVGRHARAVRTVAGRLPPVATPPVGESAIALPEAEDARVLLTPILVLLTPEAIVRFTTAIVPFDIMLAFMPEARQV
jgi:hypothetical protein